MNINNYFKTILKICIYYYKNIRIYHDNIDKLQLQNTLIICNHDLVGIDIFLVPYIMDHYFNIPICIVAAKNSQIFKTCKNIFVNQNLIETGGATDKIIENIKKNKSIVLYIHSSKFESFFSSNSLKKIINETNCQPMLLKLDFNVNINNYNTIHLKHFILFNILKKINKSNTSNSDLITNTLVYNEYVKFLLGQKLNIYLSITPYTSDNNKFINELKIKNCNINYDKYTNYISINKETAELYSQLIKND